MGGEGSKMATLLAGVELQTTNCQVARAGADLGSMCRC